MLLKLAAFVSLFSGALTQTVYLAGDSTMALGGGGSGTGTQGCHPTSLLVSLINVILSGWGVYLGQYLSIPVVNNAVGGQSARTFSEQGRFTSIINAAKSGDFVIIEFGHNDVSAGAVDNGKQSAVGDGYDITSLVTTST